MKLILVRHGRTLENDAGILQWHLPGTLSEAGREQARKLAGRLAGERIDRIVSSDLARAADTAREIAKRHPDAPLEFSEKLRERHLGQWQGLRKSTLPLRDGWDTEGVGIPWSEDDGELAARADGLLRELAARPGQEETVLLVGHSDINRALVRTLLGPESDGRTRNASVSVFELAPDGSARAVVLDDISHLTP